MRAAADSVKSPLRIVLSLVGVCSLIGLGIYWGLGAAAPSWWPVADTWWFAGGWGTGASLIGSGVIAIAMLVYSYLNFRDRDQASPPERRATHQPSPPDWPPGASTAHAASVKARRHTERAPRKRPQLGMSGCFVVEFRFIV